MKIIKIKTSRGRDGIEVNLFKYRKDKTLASGEISWRCLERKCSASLRTNNAVTALSSKLTPDLHNHEPQTSNSEPSTPTSQTVSLLTPTRSISDSADTLLPTSEDQTPSLTEILSPYTTITPEPPKFAKLDEENNYLRRRVAELVYTNEALTDRLISLEKQIIDLNSTIQDQSKFTNSEIEINYDQENTQAENLTLASNENKVKKTTVSSSTQTENFPIRFQDGINVIEADMRDVIDDLRSDPTIAFAHAISGDFHSDRQMSSGVAVIFKIKFGKPTVENCLTRSLAYQKLAEGAAVYSLVTKPIYCGKPEEEEYDLAFDDFIEDFKTRGYKTLICSPMGCVRDLITLDHFAMKINEFHKITGASVIIVTKDQKAKRLPRHGLPHTEFLKQLRAKIKKNSRVSVDWYMLPDEDIKQHLDRLTTPKNTLVLDPAVSHLIKKSQSLEEVQTLLKDAAVDKYEYVLAPVNDRKDDSKQGGSHWSLLMYTRNTDTYHHLDSLEPLNTSHAERLAARLSGDPSVNVVKLRCRRQEQGVECGAYMLQFIELICSRINKKLPVQDDRCFAKKFSINKIYENIKQLKKPDQIQKQKTAIKNKVTLMSDSHGRDLGHLLQAELGGSEVLSVVKANATLGNVTGGLDREISGLKSSDHLIVLGGTNNIDGKTVFDVKPYVNDLARKTKNTNVVLCTVPLRFDRPELNKTIRKINIDLIIEALKYDHIKIVSLSNLSTHHYNKKGLHLNNGGKQKLIEMIVDKIKSPSLN